ncbi:MAG: asparagine synthetase B family protein [Gelidibacter sp.]
MTTTTVPIIPKRQTFAKVNAQRELHLEAICIFAATGFFLDQDTYWKDEIVLKPGTQYDLDENRFVLSQKEYFKWYHEPRQISFESALGEFIDLFEGIVKEQSNHQNILLPISGGLDSRTQATALHHMNIDVDSYSYSFEQGFKEHDIAKQVAKVCNFRFNQYLIRPNYLWKVLNDMSDINGCYSEFTHPRQIAVLDDLKKMKGEFSLGHWGDVLFDRGIASKDELIPEVDLVYKKIIKKGGLALAKSLWQSWNLVGDFETYLKQRIQDLLNKIDIQHKGAKIRAFKSLYWAPRWTSVSLSFFEFAHPIHVPYYDDRMCHFICQIPEEHLADRKIQIEYIKRRNPKLAKISWQDHMPYNLYNYRKNQFPANLPYRVKNKLNRELNSIFGKKHIQRNWELQFLGSENETHLMNHLFNVQTFKLLDKTLITDFYSKFKNDDPVFYSHSVSTLLTLSLFSQKKMDDY